MSENKSLINVKPEEENKENKLNNSLEDKDKDISNIIQTQEPQIKQNFELDNSNATKNNDENKDNDESKSNDNDEKNDKNIIAELNEEKEDEEIATTSSDSLMLKLGDIIMIQASQNEILNNNVFLIEYIDSTKVKLINSDNFEKVTLSISSDGIIGDGTIESIKVISSNPDNGFARQNELLPGKWVNIYFGGDIPVVITGKIVNLEEDMIEIKTTDDDTLFINFNYQGIPEDLPIETFEIRPPIEVKEFESHGESQDQEEFLEDLENEENEEQIPKQIPTKVVRERVQKMLFEADDIQFGDKINIEEYVNIDKEKYRYNIEAQTNDLLEEMISNIPSVKRTNNVLNNIHTIITRFLQLRQMASTFDENSNVKGIIKVTSEDRPLAEYLSDFKNNLYWIMMVATNMKKLYSDKNNNNGNDVANVSDYENIEQTNDIIQMEQLFKNYKTNKNVEGQNKYNNLYYSLDPYMTPFYSLPIENNTVFNSQNGVIVESSVNTNITAIVDNLSDLYSTIVSNNEIKSRKFVLQRYNLGLDSLYAANLKGQNLIAHRVKLTNNDQLAINSMVTLPEPTLRFSKINLPGTDLLVKANLNLHFLNYWQLLKQKTDVTQVVIDGLDNELQYTDTNFVDNIKQYLLDLSQYEKPDEMTNLDIYRNFLKIIIPKIRILFNLVKKYIKGRLSLVDIVNYLEPFLIYPFDLTYFQYKEINAFIYEKINEYNRRYKEYSMAFSSIKYSKSQVMNQMGQSKNDNRYKFSNVLFELAVSNKDKLLSLLKDKILETYGIANPAVINISGSEFLKNVITSDYGNLYNTAISFTNIDLMYPNELKSVFESDNDKMKAIIEKDSQNDKCTTYIIAKKYYSDEKLKEDNGKNIYYDKEFDTTNYSILDENADYKRAKNALDTEEFQAYLENDLHEKKKMPQSEAEYMAETLVKQAKQVRNGDYAILSVNNNDIALQMEYYVRKDDTWVLEKEIDPAWFIQDNDILCNMEYSCIYNNALKGEDKCESTEVAKDAIISNALKQIIDQFDKNYNISKDQLNAELSKHINYYSKIFDKLQDLKRKQYLQSNDFQYNLGLTVKEDLKEKVVSPYTKLRDLINGQNDIVKRYSDLITFIDTYCYMGDPSIPNIVDETMEDSNWYYCKKTSSKLVPAFKYLFAKAFFRGPTDYQDTMDVFIQEFGKLSDNGDSWVDKNSGETICLIDADVSEGYKDGFKDKSREFLEKDAGEIMLEQQKLKKDKKLNPEGEIVSNIITTLTSNMGIDIENQRPFIIGVITELMNDSSVIEKEPAYKKREQEAAKKGKKLPSYVTVYSQTIMYLTLGMILIGIQTCIPSVRTKKTFPGCVRSFTGFPLEGEGDDSGLNYLSCVALKNRDPGTIPWNALPKNVEKIEATTKAFILKYLLPFAKVDQKMKDKTEYLLLNPEEIIPEEYNLNKWTNFLPPLKKFHIGHLENITEGFTDLLKKELHNGTPKQFEKLLVIQSKIIQYSLAIQEEIQKVVEKKDILLKAAGQPFVDNACCNEKSGIGTVLQYFNKESPNILQYNEIVSSLNSFIRDVAVLTKSAMFLSEVNTKRIFPEVSSEFNEETIYSAFITFCNFQNSLPLTPDLATVCIDKPNYLSKNESIGEKISKLKRDGRNYTKAQFLRLFQIVCRNNIIRMSLSFNKPSCVDNLRKVLTYIDDVNDDGVATSLTRKMETLLDSYDVTMEEDSQEMRLLKNYLQTSNDSMRSDIIEFIKDKSKATGIIVKKLTKFLKELTNWKYDTQRNADIKISNDAMYNIILFFRNFVSLFASVFPTMIKNQNMQTIEPPSYWGLAKRHKEDVKEMVRKFYDPLNKFYGNSVINNILIEIQSKCKGLELLSKTTPALSNIKIGEKEIYSVFENRTVLLLYEHYLLNVLVNYVNLTKDISMITKVLSSSAYDSEENMIFKTDFLIEQQMRFTEGEQEYIEGDVSKLKIETAKLLVAYLTIMMKSKETINVSYNDVEDRVFKLKEAEKYDFTDRLKSVTEEEREVDNILKHHKLGALYSIGLSKGIKSYDPDNFEHDKMVAEKVSEIQNKLKRNGALVQDNDFDLDEVLNEEQLEKDIATDLAGDFNQSDDYDDGDPWGDEREDFGDYY